MFRNFGRSVHPSPFVSQKLLALFSLERSREELEFLSEQIVAGKLIPVIDRTYPLDEVPEAIRHWEQGHARGKTVIKLI